ncbi:MAG: FG-GAP-like repeat-containing protein [Polyangiales bacterium]
MDAPTPPTSGFTIWCNGSLVSADDRANCGGCGVVCPEASRCSYGRCVCPYATPVMCGERCIDPTSDRAHCGGCGVACPADATACVAGACVCPAGLTWCRGACVDLAADAANCGACANACEAGSRCAQGACTCAGGVVCQGRCVDVASDRAHCGACARACPDAAQTCIAGACACPADRPAFCGGACRDVQGDREHCGVCDHACLAGEVCVAGACLGRPGSPAAGDRLATRRPSFRWGDSDAAVDVCADRACERVVASMRGSGLAGVAPASDLAPGVYFWRLRPAGARPGIGREVGPFRIDRRVARAPGLLPAAPDLDGDGIDDVVVASRARVHVFLGRRDLRAAAPDRTLAMAATPEAPRLAVAGDLRGTAVVDVVAAPDLVGRFVLGARNAVDIASPNTPTAGPGLPVGDLNGDSAPDWMIAAAQGSLSFAYRNPAGLGGEFREAAVTVSPNVTRAAPAGDVNGDGRADVLLAASEPSPRVWVGFGSSVGVDRYLALPPAPRGAGFGASLSCAGDVNGDGFAELLVGLGAAGAAVYLGGAEAVTFHRQVVADDGGDVLVGAAGDVDGDGFGDLLAVPVARGEAWLFRGSATGLSPAPDVLRDPHWMNVEALGAPGDRDGDGLDDVAAGAPSVDRVHVFFGAATSPLTRTEPLQGAEGSDFGRHLL